MSVPLLFLDANIFVAAAASSKGGSRLLFELARTRHVWLVTVAHALREAERNIVQKLNTPSHQIYEDILLRVPLTLQSLEEIARENVLFAQRFVPQKDVPILLGALASGCQFLITLDRKDFLDNKNLSRVRLPFTVATPGSFIEIFTKK